MPNQNQNSDFPEKDGVRDKSASHHFENRSDEPTVSADDSETALCGSRSPCGGVEGRSLPAVSRSTPSWQIPVGVSQGNWDYVRSSAIASDYDQFLQDNPLTLADATLLEELISPQPGRVVADFGCGNGRSLLPLVRMGADGVGVDLSLPMLTAFQEKHGERPSASTGALHLLQANLVELDALADNSVDVGICMFSTLGMIEGSANRQSFLRHVRRIVKPTGSFIVHAHNLWYQLRHPGGLRWLLGHSWSALRSKVEFGDRVANYRGVRDLFIHSFRCRELKRALVDAVWPPQRWFCLRHGQQQAQPNLPWLNALRSVGWIVECQSC